MSNVVKANFIQFSSDNMKVIDTNSLVAKRLEGFSGVLREEEPLVEETNEEIGGGSDFTPMQMAELVADRDFDNPGGEEDGGYDAVSEETYEEIARMKQEALDEIEEVKAAARAELDEIRNEARGEGMRAGYDEGLARANEELAGRMSELDAREKELEERYEKLALDLEPEMVDIITNIYRKTFGEGLYINREVMISLISGALFHSGLEEGLIVHVSAEDYEMLTENKDRLFARMAPGKEPEIRPEERLKSGEAKIETPYGILDCGIDTELTELEKTLKMLSFAGDL